MPKLTHPQARAWAAKLLRTLRAIGPYHLHPANPWARYYVAYHNCRGGVGQPPCNPNTARYYVMLHCQHVCYQAGFI